MSSVRIDGEMVQRLESALTEGVAMGEMLKRAGELLVRSSASIDGLLARSEQIQLQQDIERFLKEGV